MMSLGVSSFLRGGRAGVDPWERGGKTEKLGRGDIKHERRT